MMPNVEDIRAHLLAQDVIWVFGGSVAGLLAMWELHGVGDAMREAWEAGVVLTGVSAGSICWHVGGTTDSFGPDLRPITNGLALVPFSNGVHYDSEEQRRPLFQSLIADGTLPAGYATDDGAGVLYRGTEFVEAVSEKDGAGAYFVERAADGTAVETELDTRRLGRAACNSPFSLLPECLNTWVEDRTLSYMPATGSVGAGVERGVVGLRLEAVGLDLLAAGGLLGRQVGVGVGLDLAGVAYAGGRDLAGAGGTDALAADADVALDVLVGLGDVVVVVAGSCRGLLFGVDVLAVAPWWPRCRCPRSRSSRQGGRPPPPGSSRGRGRARAGSARRTHRPRRRRRRRRRRHRGGARRARSRARAWGRGPGRSWVLLRSRKWSTP